MSGVVTYRDSGGAQDGTTAAAFAPSVAEAVAGASQPDTAAAWGATLTSSKSSRSLTPQVVDQSKLQQSAEHKRCAEGEDTYAE